MSEPEITENNIFVTDISTTADIDKLVAEFYQRVFSDPIIGFIFTDIAHIDTPGYLAEHLKKSAPFGVSNCLAGRVIEVRPLPCTAIYIAAWR